MLPNYVFRWGKSHAKNSGGPGPSSMDNPPPEMTPAGTRPPADVSIGHDLRQRGKGINTSSSVFRLATTSSDWRRPRPPPRRSCRCRACCRPPRWARCTTPARTRAGWARRWLAPRPSCSSEASQDTARQLQYDMDMLA